MLLMLAEAAAESGGYTVPGLLLLALGAVWAWTRQEQDKTRKMMEAGLSKCQEDHAKVQEARLNEAKDSMKLVADAMTAGAKADEKHAEALTKVAAAVDRNTQDQQTQRKEFLETIRLYKAEGSGARDAVKGSAAAD